MRNTLETLGYIALAALVTSGIFVGLIWATVQVQDVLNGFYVG